MPAGLIFLLLQSFEMQGVERVNIILYKRSVEWIEVHSETCQISTK